MKNSIKKNYFVQNAGKNINGLTAGHHQRESNIILMVHTLGLMDLKNFSKLDNNYEGWAICANNPKRILTFSGKLP